MAHLRKSINPHKRSHDFGCPDPSTPCQPLLVKNGSLRSRWNFHEMEMNEKIVYGFYPNYSLPQKLFEISLPQLFLPKTLFSKYVPAQATRLVAGNQS